MKTIIAALFLTLPGCLAEIDPSLPQQVEQTIDNPPPASPPPDDAGMPEDAAPKGVPSHNIPHDL